MRAKSPEKEARQQSNPLAKKSGRRHVSRVRARLSKSDGIFTKLINETVKMVTAPADG